MPLDHAGNPNLIKILSPKQNPRLLQVNPNRIANTASPTEQMRITNALFLIEIYLNIIEQYI